LRGTIRGLRELGTTVILNSHQLTEVEQVCDRVAIIHLGRLLAVGPLTELLSAGGIRLRASGLGPDAEAELAGAGDGELERDGPWFVIPGATEEQIPGLVEMIVRSGGRVYGVELMHPTLEERFQQLLESA